MRSKNDFITITPHFFLTDFNLSNIFSDATWHSLRHEFHE